MGPKHGICHQGSFNAQRYAVTMTMTVCVEQAVQANVCQLRMLSSFLHDWLDCVSDLGLSDLGTDLAASKNQSMQQW